MGHRPQTLYGLADSPVALARGCSRSLDDISRAFVEEEPVGNTRDEGLDNITMTWMTNTGAKPRAVADVIMAAAAAVVRPTVGAGGAK